VHGDVSANNSATRGPADRFKVSFFLNTDRVGFLDLHSSRDYLYRRHAVPTLSKPLTTFTGSWHWASTGAVSQDPGAMGIVRSEGVTKERVYELCKVAHIRGWKWEVGAWRLEVGGGGQLA